MKRPHRLSAGSFTIEDALWIVSCSFAVVIPLFISPTGADVFRLPKELLIRAEMIVVLAVMAIAIIWQPRRWRSLVPDRTTAFALGAVAGAALIAYAFSTNRPISIGSIGYTFSCVVVFWGTYVAARGRSSGKAVLVGAAAAVPNAALAIAQRLDLYNPFTFATDIPHRMRTTAMIGNPNDAGASFAVYFVAILALAIVSRRWLPAATVVLLLAGVIASDALTAMIAVTAAVAAMMFLASPRIGLFAAAALLALTVGTILIVPAVRERFDAMAAAARAHDYQAFTSNRIVAFLTALTIFQDHPIAGAGPGTFKWLYLPYRLRVEAAHPNLYLKMTENLGEVHSDHLQVLAEEGLLGYAALIAGVVALASRSFKNGLRAHGADQRSQFVRLTALPLAVCFLGLAATGFPLELSAVMIPLLFFAGCLMSWSLNDTSA